MNNADKTYDTKTNRSFLQDVMSSSKQRLNRPGTSKRIRSAGKCRPKNLKYKKRAADETLHDVQNIRNEHENTVIESDQNAGSSANGNDDKNDDEDLSEYTESNDGSKPDSSANDDSDSETDDKAKAD